MEVKSLRILGIIFDSKLTFETLCVKFQCICLSTGAHELFQCICFIQPGVLCSRVDVVCGVSFEIAG